MARFWSLAGLIVGGIIIADLITHPTGTKTAFQGVTGLTAVTTGALLGGANTGGK